MEITITSEKYLNADAPEITEKMLDWLFLTMWSTRFEYSVNVVHTIDIKANTAYNGCDSIHFYITINGEHRFHKQFSKDSPLYLQNPALGSTFEKTEYDISWLGKKERWEWMEYFVQRGVDMGVEGVLCMERIEACREEYNRLEALKRDEAARENRYKLYLSLKEEFEK